MLKVLVVSMVFLFLWGISVYSLIKKKLFKEAVINTVIMIIALIYAYGEIFMWKLPEPSGFIATTFQPLAKLMFGVSLK